MKQASVENLCCTVSAAVGADRFFRQHRQSGMKIHPAPIGHAEAFIKLAALQRFPCLLVAAVADEQGRDVGVHVIGAGLDTGHAFVIGQFFTGVVDLLRQVGHAEQIDILKAVGFPELGFFRQHIFGAVCIKIHLGGQRQLVLTTEPHIKSALIDFAQALYGIFSCHLFHRPFPVCGKRAAAVLSRF